MVKEIRTVGTIVECENEILVLLRNSDRPQGNTWGLPAGKVNPNEKDLDAAIRELYEETGYKANPDELKLIGNFDWHFPEVTVYFPTFKLDLKYKFDVKIDSNEHQEYKWISPEECYKKNNLIHGFHDLIEKVYHVAPKK